MTATNRRNAAKRSGAGRQRYEAVRFFRRLVCRRVVILGIAGTVFFVLVAVFAPLIATHDPNAVGGFAEKLQGASGDHLLGTDVLGRDLFSRLVYGARVSLMTGVLATLMALLIGSFLGMAAAYFGGIVDTLLVGICETYVAIPQIAVCMALIAIFGSGMLNMALIMCIGCVPGMFRMMRASALSIMSQDYITVAKISGQSNLALMYRHVFPNSISPLIVSATQTVGGSILMESGLSFLGVGIKIPTASWGSIINEARPYLLTNPIYVLAPCVCIAALIISLNLLGDGLRDALDPTLRGER